MPQTVVVTFLVGLLNTHFPKAAYNRVSAERSVYKAFVKATPAKRENLFSNACAIFQQ